MKILFVTDWNDDFFKSFMGFKNSLYSHLDYYIPEDETDLKKFLHPESCFFSDLSPKSFLIYLENSNLVGARFSLFFPPNRNYFYLGLIETTEFHEVWQKINLILKEESERSGREVCYGPVDASFFHRYSLRKWTKISPFYKAPVHLDYYHQFFKLCDFEVAHRWYDQKLHIFRTLQNLLRIKKHFLKKNTGEIKLRNINILNWDKELVILYELFKQSYRETFLFEEISLEQFVVLYADFKYIINPLLSYILEKDGVPFAFLISYVDPLELIVEHKKNHSDFKMIEFMKNIVFFLKLKLNRKRLMVAYVGKVPDKSGNVVKGVQGLFARRLFLSTKLLNINEVIVSFSGEDSPSQKSFNPENQELVSEYVIYRKNFKQKLSHQV